MNEHEIVCENCGEDPAVLGCGQCESCKSFDSTLCPDCGRSLRHCVCPAIGWEVYLQRAARNGQWVNSKGR